MLGSHHTISPGRVIAAGGAGLLLGLLANPLRKLAVQAPTMLKGKWDEALAAEHKATLALIDTMEATDEKDTARRAMHLSQLKHSLSKHAFQEENTVYPMMREHGLLEPARKLNEEHGEVKRLLFDLTEMPKGDPKWIERLRELRGALETHMAEEENELFPKLRAKLSDEQNEHLSAAMNKEGLKIA